MRDSARDEQLSLQDFLVKCWLLSGPRRGVVIYKRWGRQPFEGKSAKSMPKLRANRVAERAAVAATMAFFEANHCVFQEVSGANDYGKDAYVDLTFGDQVTGLCAALQIKGGESYRRAGGGYAVPLDDDHAEVWRTSTVPIFGIVHDPSDGKLRWCNVSEFLNSPEGGRLPRSVPVEASALLNEAALHREFAAAVERARVLKADHALLQVLSESEQVSLWAIRDCLALGRADARVLIGLRYLVRALSPRALHNAIIVLSHATPHPDIFWHPRNWIPPHVEEQIKVHFRWCAEEVVEFLKLCPLETFTRGALGQSLYMLLIEDPDKKATMRKACILALEAGHAETAYTALYLWLCWERKNAQAAYASFAAEHPQIREIEDIEDFENVLLEDGELSLFW
jgi:hypothetical protein